MKDRILINKDLIPYTFEILLGDIWYEIEVNYNETADLFTLALYKDGKTISAGEPIIYGKPLFSDIYSTDFPPLVIVAVDESGNDNCVTWKNFNETVYLCVYNDGDDLVHFCDDKYRGSVYIPQASLTTHPVTIEAVTTEQLTEMEAAIIAVGGMVTKSKDVATFSELLTGIKNIPTTEGD